MAGTHAASAASRLARSPVSCTGPYGESAGGGRGNFGGLLAVLCHCNSFTRSPASRRSSIMPAKRARGGRIMEGGNRRTGWNQHGVASRLGLAMNRSVTPPEQGACSAEWRMLSCLHDRAKRRCKQRKVASGWSDALGAISGRPYPYDGRNTGNPKEPHVHRRSQTPVCIQ